MIGRRTLAALAGLGTLALSASAPAALGSTASLAGARLDGQFSMVGQVTKTVNIRGEHTGETVRRTWIFTPGCTSGACSAIRLVRERAHASDQLTLDRRGPGFYAGHGLFYAPLRCGGHLYPKGMSVPFRIQVHVTRAAQIGGVSRATAISATYRNRSRHNLTRCVAIPGHDAATYTGRLAPSPGGGVAPAPDDDAGA